MSFGVVVIGDEIMRGRRADKHFAKAVELLGARGLELAWCMYLGDDRARLSDFFARSLAGTDIVFSFGGIGVTPDDHTRQAVAAALRVPLELHPEARREIEARFGQETTPQRLMLGEFPRGARIIPNPYNRIPGFAVRSHSFLPGFPEMAWPMMAWVLDTWYLRLQHQERKAEASVVVYEAHESGLLDLMQRIEQENPELRVFSLPSFGGAGGRRHIELGVRGDPEQVGQAMLLIRTELRLRGLPWEEKRQEG